MAKAWGTPKRIFLYGLVSGRQFYSLKEPEVLPKSSGINPFLHFLYIMYVNFLAVSLFFSENCPFYVPLGLCDCLTSVMNYILKNSNLS